jgi:hypothetical protein
VGAACSLSRCWADSSYDCSLVALTLGARWSALVGVLTAAWPFWMAVLGVAFSAVGACRLTGDPATAIRYAGTCLQVLGLFTVAIGLRQMRLLFGRPSLAASIAQWFKQLGNVFAPSKDAVVHAGSAAMSMTAGMAGVATTLGANASLDERVSALERELTTLRRDLNASIERAHQQVGGVKAELKEERRARERADSLTAKKVEEVAIGGLRLEIVGVLWLILGVLGTSIPQEVARWVAALR